MINKIDIDVDRRKELEQLSSQVLFNNDMYKIPVNLIEITNNLRNYCLQCWFWEAWEQECFWSN